MVKIICKRCNEICKDTFCTDCSDEILISHLIDNTIHFETEKNLNLPAGTVLWWYNKCKMENNIDLKDLMIKKQLKEIELSKQAEDLTIDDEALNDDFKNKIKDKYLDFLLKLQQKSIHSTKMTSSNINFGINEYFKFNLTDFKLFIYILYSIFWILTTFFQILEAIIFGRVYVYIVIYTSAWVWSIALYQFYKNKDNFIEDKSFKISFYLTLFPPSFFYIYIMPVRIVNSLLIFPLNPEVSRSSLFQNAFMFHNIFGN